ncbi:hypothetical protein [Thalassotalea maritima]|uniref:hypothetical protein n=1 Tax=Thalassotalea maritima TaxID=3242416 RepID=UPI003527530E
MTTKFVLNGEQPIVEVLHWDDGGWQFMCNTTDNSDDGRVVCMGCLFDRYPWISEFKELKSGYLAFFDEINNEWSIEKIDVS